MGVTPEAPSEKIAAGAKRIDSSDTFAFEPQDLKESEASISKIGPEETDLVVLGCPHASIDQIKRYTNIFYGRQVKDHVEAWILTSSPIKRYAKKAGYTKALESAGVQILSGTCPSTMPSDYFEKQAYSGVATDSPKMVYYISTTKGLPCYYGSLEEFIDFITTKH